MTEEEIKVLAREYIDSCTTRAGFVILTEGIKSDFIDLFVAGFMKCLEQKATKPKWHKVADGDLPKRNCENILLYNKDHFCVTHSYSLGYYENGVFYNDCEMEEDTIAWCEIPQYTEE